MQQNPPSKFFQFFLVFGITFLMVSWLMPKPNHQASLQGKYVVSIAKSSVTIPNSPVISIENNTNESKKFEVCRDLLIRRNGDLISDLPKEFCKSEDVIAANSKKHIDTNNLSRLFYTPANFDIRLFDSGSEVSSVTVRSEEQ